mgnify:CR=1 FL=1
MTRLNGLVNKGWGSETIFATNDLYCGKLLNFNTGARIGTNLSPNAINVAKPPNNNARPSLGPGLGILKG